MQFLYSSWLTFPREKTENVHSHQANEKFQLKSRIRKKKTVPRPQNEASINASVPCWHRFACAHAQLVPQFNDIFCQNTDDVWLKVMKAVDDR